MKTKFTTFVLSAISVLGLAQSRAQHDKLIDNERKRAAKSILFNENENPNTINYDLRYIRMELDLDPSQQFVKGIVTPHFKMLSPSSTIYFDLSNNLTVSEVKYHGQNLTFQQFATKELKINFPASIPAATLDSLSISYSGVPDSSQDAFTTQKQSGVPILATLSEPFGAKEWWPTKQSLNDKIEKLDIKITTPSQYNVAANGLLQSEISLSGGKKLTYWKTNIPTPAYLVALGITNYVKLNDTFGTGANAFPFVNYIYPSTANDSGQMNAINWTKTCMAKFEEYFGPYPFRSEKYGHMQFNAGGGMEHTTMSSMGYFTWGLIAHELAHQWFGDKVTCGSWNDIWLNEGFATFGEHLIYEKLTMDQQGFRNYLQSETDFITGVPDGSVYIPDPEPTYNRIFNGRTTYGKGAYVLRMLKWEMGDDAFYAMLKAYNSAPQFANGYAKTAEFINFVNTFSGKNFNEFFNDWVYGQGYPTYTVRWKPGATNVTFKISQTQSHNSVSFYEMPLPIKVTGANGQSADLVLDHTSNNQYFTKEVGFPVTAVYFNQDLQILTKNSTVVRDNSLAVDDIKTTKIQVYPNPASTEIFVSNLKKDSNYQIFSLDGRLIKTGTSESNKAINISNLAKGEYILKTEQEQLKFIKN
ncbi:M1 family aminopeptidase [Soonwooa sp.]|uniref:M1 family metallopeptidase n=1 Tax=Soonwooa sp. TaxID=1938592 RepID=UPI002633D660|nr:M1 family aminopeptidase [Soonwooa sp.]